MGFVPNFVDIFYDYWGKIKMIISEKQIWQLVTQLKEHIELITRIEKIGDYRNYLIDFHAEIIDQQSEELKEIK